MDTIYADIEIINGGDLMLAMRKYIAEDEIKRMSLRAKVDMESYMLAINEQIQAFLQLPVMEKRNARLANGEIISCDVVSQVELRFQNRMTICNAIVLPGDAEPRLGRIAMAGLGVDLNLGK